MFVVVAMIIGPNGSFLLDVYPRRAIFKIVYFQKFSKCKKKFRLLCQFKKAEANFLMIFVCFVHKVEK
jgi:hypothetical protein